MTGAYGKYKQVRDASWQCLIDCNVSSMPVSPYAIAAQFGIYLCEYGPNAELFKECGIGFMLDADGFAFAWNDGRLLIAYDETKPRQEIRFTIAHELGHILLGHVGPDQPRGRFIIPSEPKLEREADQFAARLLAPACFLWRLNAFSPKEIAAACDIPISIARARAKRMHVLCKRNAWLHSPLEQQLLEQFEPL